MLVHPSLVSTLLKYALVYGNDGDDVPYYAFDNLIRSFALVNEKYGSAHRVAHAANERLAFLHYELESMLEFHENVSSVIARYYQFMRWAQSDPRLSDPDFVPVDVDFRRFFGMSYEEYAAAAFGLIAPFMQRYTLDRWQDQAATVNLDILTSTLTDRHHFEELLTTLSIDLKSAIEQLKREDNAFGLSDLRLFIEHPLLRLNDFVFACPYQGFLRNRLGTGLYFALFDKYRAEGRKQHLRFASFFGHFLEQYLFGLVEGGSRSQPDVRVFPEQRYRTARGESRSSDIIVVQGDTALFLEVTRSRFKLDKTLCDRDEESLKEDIDQGFVTKARQIDESIKEFRRGAYRLGAVDPGEISKFIPVIVTEQDLPQLISLPELIHTSIREAKLLQGVGTLQILAADDIEALYRSAEGTGCLVRILSGKASTESHRYRDLASYLYDFDQSLIRPSHDSRELPGYREFFDAVVMPKMREWGMEWKR